MNRMLRLGAAGVLLAACLASTVQAQGPAAAQPENLGLPPHEDTQAPEVLATGLASWYSPRLHGRKTASGERFDVQALTAAHRSLPLGTLIEVHNPANGQRVTVKVNDRGPHVRGVMIDLSPRAAKLLGLLRSGRAVVQISRIESPTS